jgi:hypothetical protein
MALKTKLELETLDVVYLGQPFVQVATTAIVATNLDTVYQAQPFYAVDPAGGVVEEGAAALSSTVTLSADANRIKEFDIALTSAFAPTMTVIAIKNIGSVLNIVSTMSADAVRNRSTDITLDSIANFNAQAGITKTVESDISSALTITADAGKLVEADAYLEYEIPNISVDAEKVVEADAYLEYEIPNIFVDVEKIVSASCDQSVAATVSAEILKIISFEINAGSLFSPSITVVATKNSTAILDSAFTFTANISSIIEFASSISSSASLSSNSGKLQTAQSNQTAVTSIRFTRYVGGTRPQQVSVISGSADTSDILQKYGRNLRIGSGYVRMANSGDYIIRSGENFIFEVWYLSNAQVYPNNQAVLFGVGQGATGSPGSVTASTHSWFVSSPSATAGTYWELKYKNTTTTFGTITSTSRPNPANWQHIAFRRINGTTLQLLVNNTVVGSATYSGEIFRPSSSNITNCAMFYRSNGQNTTLYDEASFQIGANTVLGYTGEIYNDPDTHVLLQHFAGNFDDDISYVAFANAALTSSATVTAQGKETASLSANLSSQATVSATVSTFTQFSADLVSEGFVVTAAGEITPGLAELSSNFALTCANIRVRTAQAALTSTAALTADVEERDLATAALTSTFTLTGSLKGIQQNGRANLNSTASLVCNANENPLPANPNTINYLDSFTLDYRPVFAINTPSSRTFSTVSVIDVRSTTTPSSIEQLGSSTYIGPVTTTLVLNNNPPSSNSTLYGDSYIVFSILYGTKIDIDTVRWNRRFFYPSTTASIPLMTWSDITGWNYSVNDFRIVADVDDANLFKVYRKAGSNYVLLSGTYNNSAGTTEDINGNIIFPDLIFSNVDSLYNVSDTTGQHPDYTTSTNSVTNVTYTPTVTSYSGPQKIASLDLTAVSSVSASADRVKFGAGDFTSTATQSATISRRRNISSTLTSTATLSATATNVRRVNAALSSSAAVSAQATASKSASSNLTTAVSLTANNTRLRYNSASVLAQATVSANAIKTAVSASSQTAVASQTAINTRIRSFDTSFESIASQLTAVAKVGQGFITVDAVSTLTAQATLTSSSLANIQSQATLNATVFRVASANIQAQAQITVTANSNYFKGASAGITASATLTAAPTKSVVANAAVASAFNLQTINTRVRPASSSINANATLTAEVNSEVFIIANLSSSSTVNAIGYFIVNGRANLTAFNTVLTVGDVIQLDPYLTYLVEQETRDFLVSEETRLFVTEPETRLFVVSEETRDYVIERNTAVNII